jgi:hypothetical protein
MNHIETIQYLANINSRSLIPKREEDINKNIPYFSIRKNNIGRYLLEGFAYEGHDNEPRMPYWLNYLHTSVLPHISRNIDISGYYNIELHDSYTYLNNGKDYKGVLSFAKFKDDKNVVLIPDPYMIGNYGNSLQFTDPSSFQSKISKACFYGTTTGNRNPILNERINMCVWSLDKRDKCDFYITKIAQMDMKDVSKCVPRFNEVYSSPVTMQHQLGYKYNTIIDGNTCRYDVWSLKSNSLNLKFPSKEMLWYYPILQNNTHYVHVNTTSIIDTMNFYNNNPTHAIRITQNAQEFVSTYLKSINHQMYTKCLLEAAVENK